MKQNARIIPHPASQPLPDDQFRPAPASGSPYSAVILLLFIELFVAVTIFVIPRELGMEVIRENGPVETVTVTFYFAAALLALAAAWRGGGRGALLSAIALIVLALREMDFHDRFTVMGVDRLRFYTSPEAPPVQKLVMVAVLIGLAVLAIGLLRRAGGFIRMLRRRAPYALTALVGMMVLPVSFVLDKAQHTITFDRGHAADSGIAFALLVLEETVEMIMPALFLVAAAQWIWRKDR